MRILLVDDEKASLNATAEFLREMGHQVFPFDDPRMALECYAKDSFPLVLSDVRMPGMSGFALLEEIQNFSESDATDVVLFTGFGDAESASEALRSGAYDFLSKPLDVGDLADLVDRVALKHEQGAIEEEHGPATQRVVSGGEMQEEVRLLRKVLASYMVGDELVFHSSAMLSIVEQAKQYHRDSSIPVLIYGETGTGKEVISRMIHFCEGETNSPYVDINCAAITPTLFESELFGYEGGSFTGGRARGQKGKLDLAAGGTLFLDEIGELPLEMQGKLLRVLQEKYFYRVGGLEKVPFRARLVCATNVHLEHAVAAGSFRKDLYYRLSVGNINIPPLRERREDIVPLVEIYLGKYAKEKKKRFSRIDPKVAIYLQDYAWPGNVRELKNLIEWIVFMFDEEAIELEHVKMFFNRYTFGYDLAPSSVVCPASLDVYELPVENFNLDNHVFCIIKSALQRFDGNKAKVARYLGITRRVLYGYIDKMDRKEHI